jgi:hypothetical protein
VLDQCGIHTWRHRQNIPELKRDTSDVMFRSSVILMKASLLSVLISAFPFSIHRGIGNRFITSSSFQHHQLLSVCGRKVEPFHSCLHSAFLLQRQTFTTENSHLMSTQEGNNADSYTMIRFGHVHIYVDELRDLDYYTTLQHQLDQYRLSLFQSNSTNITTMDLSHKKSLWQNLTTPLHTSGPVDLVEQLLAGLGFRIRAYRYPLLSNTSISSSNQTRSVLVTSNDTTGVQFLITAVAASSTGLSGEPTELDILHSATSDAHKLNVVDIVDHLYSAERLNAFYQAHRGRSGVAVLSFVVQDIASIMLRYQQHHPNLIVKSFGTKNVENDCTINVASIASDEKKIDDDEPNEARSVYRMLEVYAYYDHATRADQKSRIPDTGTIIRFFQSDCGHSTETGFDPKFCDSIPGLTFLPNPTLSHASASESIENTTADPIAFFDHWVSNVYSRTDFLEILCDTLQFEPQIDFNAGVVAAGEAQIESTVTGNIASPPLVEQATLSPAHARSRDDAYLEVFQDQSQVYLPINNALSSVGHVHGFLDEIGQGVQHIASRVTDLVSFVTRANEYHQVTGRGITFLQIPRSYYGTLTTHRLLQAIYDASNKTEKRECCSAIVMCLQESHVLSEEGVLDLDVTEKTIDDILQQNLGSEYLSTFEHYKPQLLTTILESRYVNIHSLLRERGVEEKQYLAIVRNQILVDVQGDDILYQIFTSKILARRPRDEAPFLEFIQRVCSPKRPIRPGCGGFGIRNFLTLFLSIEVTKALREVTEARRVGNELEATYAQQMVDYFTAQLNESNPILTEISDAMTDEGLNRDALLILKQQPRESSATDIRRLQTKLEEATARKTVGNSKLLECSAKYNQLMKSLRESRISR